MIHLDKQNCIDAEKAKKCEFDQDNFQEIKDDLFRLHEDAQDTRKSISKLNEWKKQMHYYHHHLDPIPWEAAQTRKKITARWNTCNKFI